MSRWTRRTGPVGGPFAGQSAGWDTDRDHCTEQVLQVDVHRLLGALPQVLALSATGRVGTQHARLEHLHRWVAFEKDSTFTTAEKIAVVEAVVPHMDETTVLADGIAAYLAEATS